MTALTPETSGEQGAGVQRLDHPTNDPKLPSYVGPALRRVLSDLEVTRDCWNLLRDPDAARGQEDALLRRYLPKEPREPAEAYRVRLAYSRYPSFFPDAIRSFSGVLSRFQLASPPATLEAAASNIDRQGNSLKAVLTAADQGVMRDGGCYLLVDMPAERPGSLAEERATGRRPYLTLVDRADVLTFRVAMVGTSQVATQVVVREWAEVPMEEGDYGTTIEARYRVITTQAGATTWRVLRLTRDSSGTYGAVVDVDEQGQPREGTYQAAGGRPYPRPPIAWYPSRIAEGFGQGAVPLIGLALDTLDHFRTRADQKELMRKLAMPVPVRTGMPPPPPGQAAPAVVLGANSFLDLPQGSSFEFKSPSSDSLAPRAAEVEHIEGLIREQTLSFMYGSGGGAKTATQADLEGVSSQANIRTMAEAKTNVVQQLLELWCLFTGESLAPDAGIVMDANLHDRPLGPQDTAQLSSLAMNELLSQRSLTEILIRGGVNTAATSPEQELERLEAERQAREAAMGDVQPDDPSVIDDDQLPISDLQATPQEQDGTGGTDDGQGGATA